MATAGVVKALNGKVTATDPGGKTRILKVGDKVADNEIVKSAAGSNVHIDFHNKGFVTLGSGDSIVLDRATLSDIAQAGKENTATAPADNVTSAASIEALKQQIQDIIAKDKDPAALLEAAAAGSRATGGSSAQEGSSFVIVEQNAARGELTPGFHTGTFGYGALPSEKYDSTIRVEQPSDELVFEDRELKIIIPETFSLAVHEAGLSVIGTHAGESGHPTSASGIITIQSDNGLGTVTVGGHTISIPDAWNGSGTLAVNESWEASNGTMTVDSIRYNASTRLYEVKVTYTLLTGSSAHSVSGTDNASHHDKLSEGNQAAQDAMPDFTISVTDKSGNAPDENVVIKVDIYDDGPLVTIDAQPADVDGNIHLGNSFMTDGSVEISYGADRAAATESLTISFEGQYHTVESGMPSLMTVDETAQVTFDSEGKASIATGFGILELTRLSSGEITYRYIAKNGLRDDFETITFKAKDGDGDIGLGSIKVVLDNDMPAGASYVGEAGIDGLGSHHAGYAEATQIFQVYLPENATGLTWDIATLNSSQFSELKADVDGDGNYSNVVWNQDAGGNLIGTAEGQTVITVTPSTSTYLDSNGKTVADFTVKLDYPVQHGAGSGDDSIKSLYLGYEVTYDEGGGSYTQNNGVIVNIIDDTPSAQPLTLSVVEAAAQPEDVYLVVDVSDSITDADLALAKAALIEMINKYVSEGIESAFTLVTFASFSDTRLVQVGAQEMLDYLENIDTLRYSNEDAVFHMGATNYDETLIVTKSLLEAAFGDGQYRWYQQKVYFISDGDPTAGWDLDFTRWQEFVAEHQGSDKGVSQVEVYAVGVGNDVLADTMDKITADYVDTNNPGTAGNHYIKVDSYADLADRLTDLVKGGTAQGSLLGNDIDWNDSRSADTTLVASVTFAGETRDIPANGFATFTDAESGVTIKVYSDGTYEIGSSKNVAADKELNLQYTVKDADGDSSTMHDVKIILQDARPEAFDSLASKLTGYVGGIDELSGRILLDDFSSENEWTTILPADEVNHTYGWQYANPNQEYINVDGETTTVGDSTFLAMTPENGVVNGVYFNIFLEQRTGHTFEELFSNGIGGGSGAENLLYSNPNNPQLIATGNYIEKTFDFTTAGELQLNTMQWKYGANTQYAHTFAILIDANGEVVWSGIIEADPNVDEGWRYHNGLATIPVEHAGQYTLLIGIISSGHASTNLRIDDLIFKPDLTAGENVYHGSMLEDKSPDGMVDNLGDGARLDHITVDGQVLYFTDTDDTIVYNFANGDKLTVRATGEYYFQTNSDSFDHLNIVYTIRENGSSDMDSATVYIRSDDFIHEGSNINLGSDSHNNVIIGAADTANDLTGGTGDDVIYGNNADDVIHGGAGNDVIHGGAGNDMLYGDAGDDVIYGEAGDDVIHGGTGNDVIHGGTGDDTLYGEAGNDILIGGIGNDKLYGGADSDVLFGDDVNLAHASTLLGETGTVTPDYSLFVDQNGVVNMDALNAFKAAMSGSGNDILVGGPADNILFGGAGSDTFKYQGGDLSGKTHGDLIADFHVGKDSQADILDLSDLLSGLGVTSNNALSGGFLTFDSITQNTDGTTSVTLSIDMDGSGGQPGKQLATIVMDGVTLSGSEAQQAQQLFDQLVQNDQIKF